MRTRSKKNSNLQYLKRKKIKTIEFLMPKRKCFSETLYYFQCPHCKKRITLTDKKWIDKEGID